MHTLTHQLIDFVIRHALKNYEQAREVYQNACNPSRNLDYPQAVWEAWISFEEYHGTASQLNHAKARVKKMGEALAKKIAQVRGYNQTTPLIN